MKNIKLSLIAAAIAMSFTLSACYSSGGGGKAAAIPSINTDNTSSDNTSSNNSSNNGGSTDNTAQNETLGTPFSRALKNTLTSTDTANINGLLVSVKNDGSFTGSNPAIDPALPDIDELVIDGSLVTILGFKEYESYKLVEFSNKDVKRGTLTNISGYAGSHGYDERDTDFSALRYGVLKTTDTSHLFVQGYVTPQQTTQVAGKVYALPKTGVFKYTNGNAVYGKDGQYTTSFATVIADFNNKKVKVEIKDNKEAVAKLTFGGEISGSTFQGERNNIETKGAFFGSLAGDVGGVFNDKNTGNNGVFGASTKTVSAETLENF